MTARTPSEIGRSNRNRGANAERAVVAWLRVNGFPQAERAVRTGYRTADRTSADPGDVTGCPGLVWQVKDAERLGQPAGLLEALTDTETQRAAAKADYGVLVQKRRGTTDVGRWHAWLPSHRFAALVAFGPLAPVYRAVAEQSPQFPVRVDLANVVTLLRQAGFGEPDNLTEATHG